MRYIPHTDADRRAMLETIGAASVDDLFVREAVIQDGPVIKRWWPRARGMVSPIQKKTSHIKITLTDGKTDGQ